MTSQLKVDRISPATGSEVTIDGFSAGGGLQSVQYFTSSGTWTKPDGVTKVIVEVQGAGGGGKRSDESPWGVCGGSGAYAKKMIDVSNISSATVVVGYAGAKGASANANADAGGASFWDDGTNTVTANGGAGATSSIVSGPTASGGDLNIEGGSTYYNPMANGHGVEGHDSFFGRGGRQIGNGYTSIGPTGYGAAGAGSRQNASNTDGGAGIVIVTEYA